MAPVTSTREQESFEMTGCSASGFNSAWAALGAPSTFRKYSIRACWNPPHVPKNGFHPCGRERWRILRLRCSRRERQAHTRFLGNCSASGTVQCGRNSDGGCHRGAVVPDRRDADFWRQVRPTRYSSMPRAAWRPSAMAHTTSDWPRRMSPAAKTPGTDVM
jgi:hypothetical protein